MEKIEQLTEFLGRLSASDNPEELRAEYKELLALTAPLDLARAELFLLESGMSTYDFCGLCEKITALLGDQVAILRGSLSAGHPMQRIFFQHQRYLRVLDEMENLAKALPKLHPAWVGCAEYRRLAAFGEEVDWIERHTLAEQDALMPEIERHGYHELVKIIRFHHIDLVHHYKRLKTLAGTLNSMDFDELRKHFDSIVQWLVPVGRMHIIVEENVLCPIMGSLITNKAAWDKFLAICNKASQGLMV